jgi:DNA invertase Pin-like site-specific DNA recombinase
MRVALYLRVSTSGQTVENQRRELLTVAAAKGWTVVAEFEDAGVSGARRRDKRPGLDKALRAAVRAEYDVLASWSVDRLGRSLQDLVATLEELRGANCGLYLHKQALDTSTPAGRAVFGVMSVFAEFEREILVERITAGLARARAQGVKLGRRPSITAEQRRLALATEGSLRTRARAAGVSDATVRRLDSGRGI